ncbi:MAG: ATP-binding protein [Lachnospiraceae bacterium]
MVRALWQKERATEEVTYLTELNHILEEMHQSEETIAHQQRLQIMGTVTGGIAHEFNNLLTPIMGYADLLMLELPEGSGAYDSAVEIYEASEKAKEIIQQISSLSRKNMETVYKNIHASRILKRALKMTGSVCPPNITITEDIHLEDVWILCNETQMNQMILNICVNAIHAIGHKEGDIRIQADVASREEVERRHGLVISNTWNRYVRIMISDNGCGMSEEVLKQIFDPFFTTKKGGTGTGLGLSLVEQIIHSHRGFIFAESHLEKGSTFFLYLPVNEQKEEEFYQAADGAPIRQLLIVDDNPKILKLLEKEGAKRKLTVVWRMTLEEAMEQLSTGNFQAFVVDQTVNELSGVDFCMSIQGKWPSLPKIIMADQTTKELVEAKQRGLIQGYLNKPVSMTEILKVLEEGNLNKL